MVSQSARLLRSLVHYTFTSDQALSRAAFTNMVPDFFVVDGTFAARGYGGVAAAGYWGGADGGEVPHRYVPRCVPPPPERP